MSSPYRTGALALVSRRVIDFGAGERFVLEVPMSSPEVVQALGRLLQANRPKLVDQKTGNHRPFMGVLAASQFRLTPLGSKARLLDIRGHIEARGSISIVTVDTTLRIRDLVAMVIAAIVFIAIVAYENLDAGGFLYLCLKVGPIAVIGFLAVVAAVRVGIGNVRRTIIEALRLDVSVASSTEMASPQHSDPAPSFLENPEQLVDRFDAWLRERLK